MRIAICGMWSDIPKVSAEGDGQVILAWRGEFRPGDKILFEGLVPGHFYRVKPDAAVETSLVYTTKETIIYEVPCFERLESYYPFAFTGERHYISIREAKEYEIRAYRNLALNPFDQHDDTGVYPHASSSNETRGESVFEARNVIDGLVATESHGEWPFDTWGVDTSQGDATLTVDFGRPVDIDEIRLYTRADFPHDSWWTQGTFLFSDGSKETVSMTKKTTEPHIFAISRKGITSVTICELVKAADDSPFPALTQIEVYGTEA